MKIKKQGKYKFLTSISDDDILILYDFIEIIRMLKVQHMYTYGNYPSGKIKIHLEYHTEEFKERMGRFRKKKCF